ncbi:MAG: urease accessory protein [Hyphomicrobiales bacterium]|nr:urease accessory protein [Hyphomicrobiales bacterium]
MRRLPIVLVAAMLPTAAFAHPVAGDPTGLLHGLMHPMTGPDHLLAMLAVGVFAYVLGGKALYLVPLSFVSMMAVGGALGLAGVPVPFVELGIGLSIVVIGLAAAFGRSMPVAAAMALVGTFAIFHGHAHGAEMPETASGLQYALGFIAATAALHVAGIGAAFVSAKAFGRFGVNFAHIAGAVFALAGLGVLAGAF